MYWEVIYGEVSRERTQYIVIPICGFLRVVSGDLSLSLLLVEVKVVNPNIFRNSVNLMLELATRFLTTKYEEIARKT